jgi:hypothetical protein
VVPNSDFRDDYNRLSIEILFSDAELALTFTDIALAHLDRNWVGRTVQHAKRAYESILKGRRHFPLSEDEAADLDSKLALLKERLEQLGKDVST